MNKWELERQKFAQCFLRTVRGALPLSLTNSLAKECGLTAYGNTQKFTTIDGVRYVVPDDVVLLDSVTANGYGFNLNFGITPKLNTKARVIFTPLAASASGYFGARKDTDSVRFCITTFTQGSLFAFALTRTTWSNKKTSLSVGTRYDCAAYNGKQIINGVEYNETVLSNLGSTDATFKICAPDANGGPSATAILHARYELVYIWEGETPVLIAHPAIRNNVVGYYDFVSKSFIAPTVGTLTAGKMTRTETIGGESIEVPICEYDFAGDRTENLIDLSAVTDGYYYNDSGVLTSASDARLTDWIKADAGETFTFKCTRTGAPRLRMCFFDADENYISQQNTNASDTLTATAPANTAYMRVSANHQGTLRIDWNTAMLVIGSTAPTSYIPYGYDVPVKLTAGGVTLTRHLCSSRKLGKIGSTPDTASIKDGVRTSVFRMGHKVFDGTETFVSGILDNCWNYDTRLDADTAFTDRTVLCDFYKSAASIPAVAARQGYVLLAKVSSSSPGRQAGKYVGFGTVEEFPTLAEWQAFLAKQYAAGHPVEIWYPLATAVTETASEELLVLPENDVTLDAESTVKPSEAAVTFNSRSNY